MRVIRKPTPEEMNRVYDMAFHAWAEGRTREEYRKAGRGSAEYAKGTWYVLVDGDGTLLSRMIVYPMDEVGVGNTVGFASIATPPEFAGKGYASELIRGVLDRVEFDGAEHVMLFSDIAPTFYERFGFRELPGRFQKKAGSVCMIRSTAFDHWSDHPHIVPPEYF